MHVVPHMDEEASGPSQSVLRLCEALADQGDGVQLHTMAAGRSPNGVDLVVHRECAFPRRFGFSLGLTRALSSAAAEADIVHNHSLWSFPNMAAGLARRREQTILVTSPRGTLAPAARERSRAKKSVFKVLQWPAIARAACLHATSDMEYQDIRALGLRHPVAVIPNGIDIPPRVFQGAVNAHDQPRRLLFLGRIHPIKGIELLLNAWRTLQGRHTSWELVIAGKGDTSYESALKAMAVNLKLERIKFMGPVYKEAKRDVYFTSELFVLPTQTENFGMAIAEAQAHGVPVITTHGAPWAGLVSSGSGWWIERKQDAITSALDGAMKIDRLCLREMGERGRTWMNNDFSWPSVAQQMSATYRWLHQRGKAPACLHLD